MSRYSGKVEGQRSPKWVVWMRMTIPCKNGLEYLTRLRIVQTPYFGIFLHDIHEDDSDRCCHNHPWTFFSFVVRGWYSERLYPNPVVDPQNYVVKVHRRFSLHRMDRESAHRLTYAETGLKTLIFVGPRRATWALFDAGRFVEWQAYEREVGTM